MYTGPDRPELLTIVSGIVAGTAAWAGATSTPAATSAPAAIVHNFLVVRMREIPSSWAGCRGGRALGQGVRALSWSRARHLLSTSEPVPGCLVPSTVKGLDLRYRYREAGGHVDLTTGPWAGRGRGARRGGRHGDSRQRGGGRISPASDPGARLR